ncbi:Armadillo-type fold protein [Cryptosporidium parvum]|nr:Uncharacterized protein with Armadillo-type fold [Cryptosporidium parvum]WKS76504.1 hypothetical protein CPCDC_2g2080 [Cryptosporidium sp. 43IA8]WRK30997.1 Armadillo-type fold protein [Cryptosporidium parvum]|eukprot:QOY43025.1 hypothetical protein CPATCC_000725 [Cryptosporidium parvum]
MFDWSQLLKWSSRYIEDTYSNSNIRHIDPERLEFLQGAVREAMKNVVDPNKLILEAKDKLSLSNDEEVLASLAVIDRCVELPDCALNFEKLGIVQPLLSCLSRSEEVRSITYQILSKSMQNNLPVQNSFAKLGALSLLKQSVQGEDSETNKSKGITAISSLVRHNKTLEGSFISDNGIPLIALWLHSENVGVRERALSLLRHLLIQGVVKSEYIIGNNNSKIIDTILTLSKNNSISNKEYQNIQYGETISETLLELINAFNPKLSSSSKDKIREEVNKRMIFLIDYCKLHPDDDISPEYSTLIQCEKLLV